MEHVAHLQRMANESWIGSPERAALDAAIASLSAPQSDSEWVLVPKDAIERAIETLENDGDEHGEGRNLRAMLDAAPQPPADAQPCGCGEATCTVPWEPGCGLGKSEQHAEAQAQGVGEALEAELIALVAGPYHYHHKMDEHAEREGKSFDRCRELTIQNIRTWCATRRAMLAAQPPSAPVGVVDVDALAQEIRRVDGEHSLGASALAEALVPYLARTTIAQQPAADGGFTAADMMDARQEGRKEAQQPAAVDGADAKDAEIERLRAEREVIGAEAVKYAGKSGRLEAKVYLLAEALRFARTRFAPYMDDTDRTAFDAALRNHDQENK